MTDFLSDRVLSVQSVEKALGTEILLSKEMQDAQILWDRLYRNRAPWVTDSVKSLSLAPTVSNELACQVTLDFTSTLSGSARADWLNKEVYQKVLADIRQCTEYACASGGVVFKPYVERGGLAVEYVRADRFFPIAVNCRGHVVSAAFSECTKHEGRLYCRLEIHRLERDGVRVQNRAFTLGGPWGLGQSVSLEKVPCWAELSEDVFLAGVDRPLFSYFKMPFANVVEPDSPLGVSAYARATDLIREADLQFSRLLWEYEGGELAIDASVDALMLDKKDIRMPKLNKRLFRALDIDAGNSDLYSVFAPALRDASYLNGLTELLIRIEDLCGLARGTFSNLNSTARTATELNILRQRTYATVTDIQKLLQNALEGLLAGLELLTNVYHLAPAGACTATFSFDDSVVTDRAAQFEEMQLLTQQGILNPWELRSWYMGETEEQAKQNLPRQIPEELGVDME